MFTHSRILLLLCLFMTLFVVHTASQIEYRNVLCGHFLPRSPSDGPVSKWEILDLKAVLENVDDQIFERREHAVSALIIEAMNANGNNVSIHDTDLTITADTGAIASASSAAPDSPAAEVTNNQPTRPATVALAEFIPPAVYGPPYSPREQRSIDSIKQHHGSLTSLRWWVSNFGIAQYFIAPTTLVLALFCTLRLGGTGYKSTAALCALVSGSCVFLMLVRGYWHAMGA
jgi:hypothetical protein